MSNLEYLVRRIEKNKVSYRILAFIFSLVIFVFNYHAVDTYRLNHRFWGPGRVGIQEQTFSQHKKKE
ncbi:hypothetical protein BCR42DRAFT_413814 [Absidia repens]|uniref:Uncharacterized protein n=1 Tax=Absidia repens TaxID=90262 RepID=A0A1X2II18_9FUNG|nr:hypothetical protein BCR42DRAFT_413814 [Absidia repens]